MKILVSNDDGICAPGLWDLAGELRCIGQVVVVAPDREQSGSGTSVTLYRPLRITVVQSPIADIEAYSVEGTPADSVIIALRSLIEDEVALVVCGINEGPNLGDDAFISGTVGGALQGYFYGIPSIAVSVADREDFQFRPAAKLAKLLGKRILEGLLPPKILLNVNLPNVIGGKINDIEVTRLGMRDYRDKIEPEYYSRHQYFWIRRGEAIWEKMPGSDIWAIEQNCISITPLLANPRTDSVYRRLRSLAPGLLSEFRVSEER